MEDKLNDIKKILLEKSSTKQNVFIKTREVFNLMKQVIKTISTELGDEIYKTAPVVEIKYYEKSDLEVHLKFSGDTLVFMMHTNIFNFDSDHYIQQSDYVKQDPLRQYCGMIQIYNFLADSLKYNREGDYGYLVGRIFINKEKHFFVEGRRPLAFRFNDFACCEIHHDTIRSLLLEAMHYCLNFDLTAPPVDDMSYISVEQKNLMSYSSGMPTSKRLGFSNQSDSDTEN